MDIVATCMYVGPLTWALITRASIASSCAQGMVVVVKRGLRRWFGWRGEGDDEEERVVAVVVPFAGVFFACLCASGLFGHTHLEHPGSAQINQPHSIHPCLLQNPTPWRICWDMLPDDEPPTSTHPT